MPTFITRGRYSAESIKKMVASPEDRETAVRSLVESSGGKLRGYYVTLGKYDWMTIVEAPSAKEGAAFILAAAASGSVTDIETIEAFNGAEAKEIFTAAGRAAGKYTPPGTAR
jgi:uncharacterized protein with GYD domain